VGIGTSILLIAVGAILRFAVSVHRSIGGLSVNWHVVGDVLMIVGAIGLVASLLMSSMWTRRERVIEDR
jgi:hypothetical protein